MYPANSTSATMKRDRLQDLPDDGGIDRERLTEYIQFDEKRGLTTS